MLRFLERLLSDDTLPLVPLTFEDEAIVKDVVQQGQVWRVAYKGTQWNARCNRAATLKPGDVVYVIGRQGITLLIEPRQHPKR